LPWSLPGNNGQPIGLSLDLIRTLLPSAFAIAVLGAIESLLSAVVADGMAKTKHNPDSELIAQGIGNIIGPFFGGFAATGAIARTATNIRSGGRSPIASFTHSIFVLSAILLLAPLVAYLPMASLAGLLLLVAWNMSEAKHFVHIVKIAPRSDVLVLLVCFSLTVVFDMVIGVSVGLVLSSLLFMHWMAITSKVNIFAEKHSQLKQPLPPNTMLYEISGPLFFGAAQKAMSIFNIIDHNTRVIILHLSGVQLIDATGLISLESVLDLLKKKGIFIIISGITKQPATVLVKAGIHNEENHLFICKKYSKALEQAWLHINKTSSHDTKLQHKEASLDKSFV
jgi:SulP family sulfate permease